MKKFPINREINEGFVEVVVCEGSTRREKAVAAEVLGRSLIPLCPDNIEFPANASSEELHHSLPIPGPHEFGYTLDPDGNVVEAFVIPLSSLSPYQHVLSYVAGANKLVMEKGKLTPMISDDDIKNAAMFARQLSQEQLDDIGQRIWGSKYDRSKFDNLGIHTSKLRRFLKF